MGEPKPLASLSAGLLARKGGARPAMRRQPLGSGPAPMNSMGYDDLGWNDMGYDVDPDQSGEPTRMLDLKPLLTGSVLAHNVEAEHAVDESEGHDLIAGSLDVDHGAEPFADEAPEVPEVVRQQESLIERVAAVARKVEACPEPAPMKERPRVCCALARKRPSRCASTPSATCACALLARSRTGRRRSS